MYEDDDCGERPAQEERLIVVEAANFCECHLTVTARTCDYKSWVFIFVKSPMHIGFGDILAATPDENGFFVDVPLSLDRGPGLRYKLITEPIPVKNLERLLLDADYVLGRGKYNGT